MYIWVAEYEGKANKQAFYKDEDAYHSVIEYVRERLPISFEEYLRNHSAEVYVDLNELTFYYEGELIASAERILVE